jgi:hypothetical protein
MRTCSVLIVITIFFSICTHSTGMIPGKNLSTASLIINLFILFLHLFANFETNSEWFPDLSI